HSFKNEKQHPVKTILNNLFLRTLLFKIEYLFMSTELVSSNKNKFLVKTSCIIRKSVHLHSDAAFIVIRLLDN
ncbi:hypothetical protein, partial [Listeria seeligeri]|uniref:hypothetical protein n=1 Tax=Listeria seeligeri TaxID=1640 RepID=UPI001E2D366E